MKKKLNDTFHNRIEQGKRMKNNHPGILLREARWRISRGSILY